MFYAIADHARYQASRYAETRDFGLDVERDLVWAVTGKPAREVIGQKITGRDAFCTNAPTTLPNLQEYLTELYLLYQDTAYLDNYPWVERINEVKDPVLKDRLDTMLIQKLRTRPLESTWLAPPEILEWERVNSFGFGTSSRHFELFDLHWNHYFLEICPQEEIDIDKLRRSSAFCFGEDGQKIKQWELYKCVYAEIELDQSSYFLSSGRWYLVDRNLVVEVDRFMEGIPWVNIGLPSFETDTDEDEYNVRVARERSGGFFLGHKKPTHVRKRVHPIEFCDLAKEDGDLIHVKRYRSSKDLSHLFAQGLTPPSLCRLMKTFVGKRSRYSQGS